MFGEKTIKVFWVGIPVCWIVLVGLLLFWVVRRSRRRGETFPWLYYLFFFSGFPALIYQIVWERALFTIYGVNIESVTVVVTGFLLGLGLGSLLGGRISLVPGARLLELFGFIELSTAVYGIFSLKLFHAVALYTAGCSLMVMGLISFSLVVIPTILMGSTLPLLVTYMVSQSRNVGQSLGMLYFVNTLGSAVACFVAAGVMMRLLGQSGSVAAAAVINACVGSGVLALHFLQSRPALAESDTEALSPRQPVQAKILLPFPVATALVAVTGFIALAYEIVWYRLASFYSGTRAMVFACLLGAYLLGIAVGGLLAHDLAARSKRDEAQYLRLIAWFVLLANLVGYLVLWSMGFVAVHAVEPMRWLLAITGFARPAILTTQFAGSVLLILPIIAVAAAFLAATFPLICHLSLPADARAGSGLGVLYFSNIVGSAFGSFLVGFILMDIWGVRQLSIFLALLGVGLGLILLLASRPDGWQLASGAAAIMVIGGGIVLLANPLFNGLYEKMLFRAEYRAGERFAHLVENRSGVIAVDQERTVYGGGIYDGKFNVDLVHDGNNIYRLYALSSFHALPRSVLMVGLSSGSWAQVLANHPQVQELTIVEINPGYFGLIRQYPQVASILRNPKVHFVVDDGRRWLVSNPKRRFDVIVMNTTFNWREHASNILSVEFLQLARQHLLPGGVLYYNATNSGEVMLTGSTVFPYALRLANFLAVSDTPIELDTNRLARTLTDYEIDGHPVLDLRVPADLRRFQQMLALTRHFSTTVNIADPSIEFGDSLRARYHGLRLITDDNMGTEWSATAGY